MKGIIKLKNPVKNYSWGSTDFIPALLNLSYNGKTPFAELWVSTHNGGLSVCTDADNKNQTLKDVIQSDSQFFLGKVANKYDVLPYLFKILSASTPLSIQAHPDKIQAENGFRREQECGIALDAPERNYKDCNHKPEIICALTDFTAMCGFRQIDEIKKLFCAFDCPVTNAVAVLLTDDFALRNFFTALMYLENESQLITDYVKKNISLIQKKYPKYKIVWDLISDFCDEYPGDAAVIAPLYLNVICLKPGESFFIPASVLHAYCMGSGVELMAASDNVLRGGLTKKYIDKQELINILMFKPFCPVIQNCSGESFFTYDTQFDTPIDTQIDTHFDDFKLSRLKNYSGNFPVYGPVVIFITNGTLIINSITGTDNNKIESLTLTKGMSVFTASGADRKNIFLEGNNYTAYTAAVGYIE
ncbi:MAG: mannose-6-phosphate isomerase, class I [Termitinemataceae bacterium]|nr:MAG: mannose-6-phosphate isomerase, class I [Termitinemataceae bacterium]